MFRPGLLISGGQSGADQGGLRAATALGIPTGGFCPEHFRTEDGPCPELGTEYGLTPYVGVYDYGPRTEKNVYTADATVIFGRRSAGSNLTESTCCRLQRPFIWITDPAKPAELLRFRLWMARVKPSCLNCAGNRESKTPGIGALVEAFLIKAFGG